MTRATQADLAREREATDADLQRRVIERAERFEAQGFIVTRQLEVEARGAADLLSVEPATLRQWRCYGRRDDPGPPWRKYGPQASEDPGSGRAWYPISGLLEWIARTER